MATVIASEIEIDAPVSTVWGVLNDIDSYGEWNPFTPRVETDFSIGSPIRLHVQMTPKRRMLQIEYISAYAPEREMSWRMKILHPSVLCAERRQLLTALEGGGTHYRTEDTFKGFLVPLMMRIYGKNVQRGFDGVATGLKERAEKLS